LLTRRQFIKVGIAGAALLAAARFADRPRAAAASYRALDEQGAAMIAALIPVVLSGVLPAEADARARAQQEVLDAFDRAVSGLSPAIQEEIGQLFSFLSFAPTRITVAGLWSPLAESTPEEIRTFLDRWRASRFDLQRVSYQALTQLILAAWYGNSAAWPAIGYAGPPGIA
jgi:hypothetical protein